MNRLDKLWKLQQLEVERQKLIRNLDTEKFNTAMTDLKQNLDDASATVDKCRKKLQRLEKEVKSGEDLCEELDYKMEELNSKLYGGEVNNPKELHSLQEQIETLQREKNLCEEKIIANMEEIELEENALFKSRQTMQEAERKYSMALQEAEEAKASLETNIAALQIDIDRLMPEIDAMIFELYNKEKGSAGKTVVAKVHGEACGACHVEQPVNRLLEAKKGNSLVRCENCGRILFVE